MEEVYKRLLSHFGPQRWWPARNRFEVIVGAVLTQNTNWRNVEKAIGNLRREKMLSAKKIASAKLKKIQRLIRPSGFYRQKAKRLREAARFYLGWKANGSMEEMRRDWLGVNGIGKETADSILLYAYGKPVFVIDAYTKRIAKRHFGFEAKEYESYREFFEKRLRRDAAVYNEMHALLVRVAKEYCKKEGCECPKGLWGI